jgi:hypothetical protein
MQVGECKAVIDASLHRSMRMHTNPTPPHVHLVVTRHECNVVGLRDAVDVAFVVGDTVVWNAADLGESRRAALVALYS